MSHPSSSTERPAPETGPGEGERFSLWQYATVLVRRRRVALAVPPAIALLVGVLSLLSPRHYVASASFVLQAPTSSVQSSLGQLASQFGLVAPRASAETPQFYADLVRSRELLRDIVAREYDVDGKVPFRGTLAQYFGVPQADSETRMVATVAELRAILGVTTDRNTGVVRIQLATRSPGLSEKIVSSLVDLLNDYNLSRRQSQARAERAFVEERMAQARDSLSAAESALTNFYQRNRRFQASPELVAEEGRLLRRVNLLQQLFLTLSQNHEAAKIEEVRNTPVITVLERPQGFVEPKSRGTIRKAVTAAFVSGLLVIVLAFAEDHVARLRAAGARDYLEFAGVLREALGRLFSRRPA